jgi:hypothetical protein
MWKKAVFRNSRYHLQNWSEGPKKTTKKARIADITAEIRTGHVPNTVQKSYLCKRVAIGTKGRRNTEIKEDNFMTQSSYLKVIVAEFVEKSPRSKVPEVQCRFYRIPPLVFLVGQVN